jgi:hypothetical protein
MTITMTAEGGLALGQFRKHSASECELALDLREAQLGAGGEVMDLGAKGENAFNARAEPLALSATLRLQEDSRPPNAKFACHRPSRSE